jgi:hypothetical protein
MAESVEHVGISAPRAKKSIPSELSGIIHNRLELHTNDPTPSYFR